MSQSTSQMIPLSLREGQQRLNERRVTLSTERDDLAAEARRLENITSTIGQLQRLVGEYTRTGVAELRCTQMEAQAILSEAANAHILQYFRYVLAPGTEPDSGFLRLDVADPE